MSWWIRLMGSHPESAYVGMVTTSPVRPSQSSGVKVAGKRLGSLSATERLRMADDKVFTTVVFSALAGVAGAEAEAGLSFTFCQCNFRQASLVWRSLSQLVHLAVFFSGQSVLA